MPWKKEKQNLILDHKKVKIKFKENTRCILSNSMLLLNLADIIKYTSLAMGFFSYYAHQT